MESNAMYRTPKPKRVTPPRRWNLRTDRLLDIPAGMRLTAHYFAAVGAPIPLPPSVLPPAFQPFVRQVHLFGWTDRPNR